LNSFWKGQVYAGSGATLTRQAMANYLAQITDNAGGEAPDCVIMSPSDYAALNATFIGTGTGPELFYVQPGKEYSMDTPIRSSFPNVSISGIPFFADHFCPKGTAFYVNSKYTSMYLSEDAPFAFSGFQNTIALMQVAQIGVALVGYQILTSKPLANAVATGITGGAW
jgi:hypothetical protein